LLGNGCWVELYPRRRIELALAACALLARIVVYIFLALFARPIAFYKICVVVADFTGFQGCGEGPARARHGRGFGAPCEQALFEVHNVVLVR
jgi:hypothetical protein